MNYQLSEERLWDYIDGTISAGDKTVIEEILNNNAEWNAKYKELLEVHTLMQSSELDEPSMRFTQNVMDDIAKLQIAPAAKAYINNNIIRGIAIFFITTIVGFIIYGIGQVNWKQTDSNSTSPINFNKIDFSNIDYSSVFNNNIMNAFMMVNIILGLFFLDRVLASKRRRYRSETGILND